MATLREKVEALESFLVGAEAFNLPTTKGFPDFVRTKISPPVVALLYRGSGNQTARSRRVGATSEDVAIDVGLYALNEIKLFEMAEQLQRLRARKIILTAGDDNQPVQVVFGADERFEPQPDDPKEARHVTFCPVMLIYE